VTSLSKRQRLGTAASTSPERGSPEDRYIANTSPTITRFRNARCLNIRYPRNGRPETRVTASVSPVELVPSVIVRFTVIPRTRQLPARATAVIAKSNDQWQPRPAIAVLNELEAGSQRQMNDVGLASGPISVNSRSDLLVSEDDDDTIGEDHSDLNIQQDEEGDRATRYSELIDRANKLDEDIASSTAERRGGRARNVFAVPAPESALGVTAKPRRATASKRPRIPPEEVLAANEYATVAAPKAKRVKVSREQGCLLAGEKRRSKRLQSKEP
jgi:hypothetical protein